VCAEHGLEIPGLRNIADDKGAAKQAGLLLSRCFKSSDNVTLDEWTVQRTEIRKAREDGTGYFNVKSYTFNKVKIQEVTAVPQQTAVSVGNLQEC